MSEADRFDGTEELAQRWQALGFVRKGKDRFVRVVPLGLEMITAPPRGGCNGLGVVFAVWFAPLAARERRAPVRWPSARYAWPDEHQRHDSIQLQTLSREGHLILEMTGARGRAGVATLWRYWPDVEAWFAARRELGGFIESCEGEVMTGGGNIRLKQVVALSFLELGEPARAIAMMELERDRIQRAPAWGNDLMERTRCWEERAVWWHDIAGLAPPLLDGTPRPRGWTTSLVPPPRPRDSIWYASPSGREWMKTREPDVALARAAALLRFTTFTAWDTAQLQLHNRPAQALVEIEARTSAAWSTPRPFTAHELTELGLELDPILADGIARFGPVRFRRWGMVGGREWDAWLSYFFWERTAVATPDDWRAFCVAHQGTLVDARPRVELTLEVRGLALRAKADGPLLPYQGPEFCPPPNNTPSWPAEASLTLDLPRCRMSFTARLPFATDDAGFRAYLGKLSKAVGFPLARTHLRALIINQAGTRAYDRKLAK